ncbi:lamin tail domain-containing protein [Paenibacillus sp. CC-CFT747]|nr:lamin tail domain-containing protein [Paenibacillus sp. CC-CFT747]
MLVTEIVPDSVDVEGPTGTKEDAFEYIEIYNNSDKAMNLKDYQLLYRYPTGPQDDLVLATDPSDVVLPPGKTLLIWLKNATNANLTMEDFNRHFGTDLVLNTDVVRASAGLHSGRTRWIVVATKTGQELVSAVYNDGVHDAMSDMGVVYGYPRDGSRDMIKLSSRTVRATPGSLDPGQVPESYTAIPEDKIPPVIINHTGNGGEPAAPATFEVQAEDSSLVKTVTLFYKTDKQTTYTPVNLKQDKETLRYGYTLDGLKLLGSTSVDYYFTASDGFQESRSETFRYRIAVPSVSPRLNLSSGEIVKGSVWVKGTSNETGPDTLSLAIDGKTITPVQRGQEGKAYFTFEANGVDNNYQNIVKQGSNVVHELNYKVTGFNTVTVPVDGIVQGENKFSLTAGSYTAPYDGTSTENLDDFDVRNIRLILADGTVLRDPKYSSPSTALDMGDNGRFLPVVNFTFSLTEEQARSLVYSWDTSSVTDGVHQVTVTRNDGKTAQAAVRVDNHGPVITTSLEDGKEYKGTFTVEGTVVDETSGVESASVQLDGKPVTWPLRTSSAELESGTHVLQVQAADKAGNRSERTVTFKTVEENPYSPELVSPANGAEGESLNPLLEVKVTDPTGDAQEVSFFRGYSYPADDKERTAVYSGASVTEPPLTLEPEGERPLTEEETAKIKGLNQTYLVNDSVNKFPYLRYKVRVEDSVTPQDNVELVWKGHSLPGRKVSLYAWDYQDSKWKTLDSVTARSEEDFELRGKAPAARYVRNGTANLLIQDQVEAEPQEDYTFVWMSDTQYYSQTYSHIYEAEVNWIRDHAKEENIRYVFHTGDLVENWFQHYQWKNADRYMKTLEDANIPYGVLAGNHDVSPANDYTNYSSYFGESRFAGKPFYGGTYKDNRGHYDLISAGGTDYIMVYMGWGKDRTKWHGSTRCWSNTPTARPFWASMIM